MKKQLFTSILLACFSLNIYAAPVKTEDTAYKAVEKSIFKNKLTSLKANCIKYRINENTEQYEVDVFEIHNKKCGGDPSIERRMFGYLVDKKTGELKTDAMRDDIDWDGDYHPIK
ncbi:hypothetical protein [Actinobacillus porcinus]|uniref:hypothetical protein n=1 Tax=Actinobacillus porcinus TaxID=51048 RepID=UPI002A8494A3|nr:hypothetical protein [Actinobacillus porcinus]MCI7353148.1 hypothetical protein [[Actinobacillus] rossii]MDY4505461.1 hypothetical protein [[Actinobacillus] rossii]MDY5420764.1 hypothetical protein [Actinobacillus porcinus]